MPDSERLPRRLASAPVRLSQRMSDTLLPARIEHSDLNRKVYDRLRAAVLSGELHAGQKLNLTTLSTSSASRAARCTRRSPAWPPRGSSTCARAAATR